MQSLAGLYAYVRRLRPSAASGVAALCVVLCAGLHPLPAIAAQAATLTIAYPQYLWPKVDGVATVYYVIDPASDPNATPKIQAAIKTFNADFPDVIQWVAWTSSAGTYYVDINLSASDLSGQCEANEGYEGVAAQAMNGSTACTIGTILHEMGHVVGLWHEQSRADRASYVDVSYANVIKGAWPNFLPQVDDAQILGPYDYASVMQYIPFADTRNGAPVIESIPAGIALAGYAGVPAQAGASGGPAQPVYDYSAGDKESILRLYGAAPKSVTVTSNPAGLQVVVDGITVTTPQTYAWHLYTTHTLGVPAGVQTLSGDVLDSNPPVAATFYYTYGRWNDSTAQSHSITLTPGNGSPAFPAGAPALSTYSANFIQLVPAATAISPAGAGSLAVSPPPQSYAGASGEFFVARQEVTLTATAAAGWNFYEFINSPFWLPGGLGANPKTFYVPDSGNPVSVTAYFSSAPVYTVDVQPGNFSSGLYAYVDDGYVTVPKNFSASYDSGWTPGSTHTLALDAIESPYSVNSRYSFQHWSDGGALSHSIASLPAAATTYLATVQAQYRPATNFGFPPCGGSATLSPASPTHDGFYPSGQVLKPAAAADSGGWVFAGWTFDLTGTLDPASLTAKGETLIYANFNTTGVPLTLTALSPSSAKEGGKAFVLTLTGAGFTANTLVSVNGTDRSVLSATPQKLTVQMTPADIASAGAFQVFVEDYPAGWSGCAVFGARTFLVEGKGPPVATPVFSPKGGSYASARNVSISDAVSGATIYYTTDGTTPTTSSPVYSGTIAVGASETLKANAVAAGYLRSATATASYIIQ